MEQIRRLQGVTSPIYDASMHVPSSTYVNAVLNDLFHLQFLINLIKAKQFLHQLICYHCDKINRIVHNVLPIFTLDNREIARRQSYNINFCLTKD